jgi:hypothetical protein
VLYNDTEGCNLGLEVGVKKLIKEKDMGIKAVLRFEDYKKVDGEYKFVEVPVEVFEAEDGRFLITDENGGPIVIDYYDYFVDTAAFTPI